MSKHGCRLLFSIFIAASLGVGCADDDGRLETYPVQGQVIINGQPAAGCTVAFVPNDPKLRGQIMPGGKADETGSFSLTTYETDDGAPAGEYGVTIRWPAQKTWPGKAREMAIDPVEPIGPDKLQGRLSSPQKSGLTVTVKEEENILPPFEFSDVPLLPGAE